MHEWVNIARKQVNNAPMRALNTIYPAVFVWYVGLHRNRCCVIKASSKESTSRNRSWTWMKHGFQQTASTMSVQAYNLLFAHSETLIVRTTHVVQNINRFSLFPTSRDLESPVTPADKWPNNLNDPSDSNDCRTKVASTVELYIHINK